ncbi:indoleamine 2,3-dioxygenase-like protein [Niveomyces insectorum RCEF 264]|uniref:Indoleamine 2,3-dioxygenase-like protein n=1 Tax=Niveomyces insectorum RCEF 264 TaxID=1081102 RepID=A0A167ME06_9HYPO|nr:indoleamine 2,3-dioxygenase-like protein [Niveomyces insectorum RCEF 264]
MGSIVIDDVLPPTTFEVLEDACPNDTSRPAFLVSKTRGFLPRADPVVALPPAFAALESLLARMPVQRLDGQPGLLAAGMFGDAVRAELPDLTDAVEAVASGGGHHPQATPDLPLLNALYRDYSFVASAYLLEPCHLRFVRGEPYGLGRDVLPAAIARPMARCAELCGFKPFMEYAGSYALFNSRLADPAAGLAYDNLRLIRAFERGLDPASSEAGFVLVHVAMVQHSGPLVAGTCACLDAVAAAKNAAANTTAAATPRQAFNAGLAQVLAALQRINGAMETMWARSRPAQYTSFRTFIFGITAQSMFPDGVVYEGVDEHGRVLAATASDPPAPGTTPGTRLRFRGESGANDSMIPLMDNLLQVPMPDTPLTAILQDFRAYRPSNHRAFLAYVRARAAALGVKAFALAWAQGDKDIVSSSSSDTIDAAVASCRLWLQVLDQVRDFRWRHWCFAKSYILAHTAHPTATGGSPVVTWLPNQLQAVLAEMQAIGRAAKAAAAGTGQPRALGADVDVLLDRAERQQATLAKEVARYCAERGV